jgi:MFS superfamily sulfate permease-like transporter
MRPLLKRLLENRVRFGPGELTGAVGDLGTMIPLAFALVLYNGYAPERLFLLWGLVYMATGLFYGIPVSVQPLKAMAVIAMAGGFSVSQLSTAAVFYGLIFLGLSATGLLRWLEQWFTPPVVRGIQLGIGLILLGKAVELVRENGLYLGQERVDPWLSGMLMTLFLVGLAVFQFRKKIPVSIGLILGSIVVSLVLRVPIPDAGPKEALVALHLPDSGFFWPALVLLILPQLPLTLGNAVFAACDVCHTYWKNRAWRATPVRFGWSIGLSNLFIGLLGGFPICHGAGGIAAHARFGGRTGATTLFLGTVLVLVSLFSPLARFLFLIPIPLLGSLLVFVGLELIGMIRRLEGVYDVVVAVVVGILSFFTRNLSIALVAGIVLDQGRRVLLRDGFLWGGVKND